MSRYIDADNLISVLDILSDKGGDIRYWEQLKWIVADCPTADVVEVVRCRECRWGREVCGNIECSVDLNAPTEYHGYDWFCPNGEKMDEVGE